MDKLFYNIRTGKSKFFNIEELKAKQTSISVYSPERFRIARKHDFKPVGYIDPLDIGKRYHIKKSKDEIEEQNISRSKRTIRELCLCNNFEYFVTLTLNSENADRFSLDSCQNKLRETLKAYKRKNKEFAYIIITEAHKNGAFHFHGLFKNINPSDLIEYHEEDFKKLPYYILDKLHKNEKLYYLSFFDQKMGYCTLTKIKSLERVSSYITKYVTKSCVKNSKGTIYISSRGLKKADKIYCDFSPPSGFTYENNFVSSKEYSLENLSPAESFDLLYLEKFNKIKLR